MDFSVPQLFAQFVPSADDSDDPVVPTLTRSDLAEALGTDSDDYLDVALDALTRIGHIVRVDQDNEPSYTQNPDSKLVEGQLRCSSKGFCFAISNQPGVDDIYIHGSNLNGAWNGDRVIAKVVKEGNRRRSPEGHVAAVIERANPTVVAKLEKKEASRTALKGVPLDDRLLFELDLAFPKPVTGDDSESDSAPESNGAEEVESPSDTTNTPISKSNGYIPPEAEPGKFVYVEVERYPLAQIPPLGLVRKVLGSDSGTSMDIDLVCCKHNLPQAFPDSVETAAAKIKCKLNKTDLKKRQDCRDWYTLALRAGNEPAQLAVSLDRQEDSSWRLGIHITDVAQTLLADHPVNIEAQERGMAIHLDDVTVPLFPERVLQQCSFAAGSDRPAISVIFTLTPNGVAQSFSIHQTSVCCDTRLTLEQAQSLVDSDDGGESNVARLLQHLMALQEVFQEQRHDSGGWDLPIVTTNHQPRSVSGTADEGNQSALALAPSPSVAGLVAELQTLANATIAKHFQELGVPALYRGCPLPGAETVQTFLRLVDNLGMELSLQDDETVALSDLQVFANAVTLSPQDNRSHLTQQLLNAIPAASEQLEPQLHSGVGYNPYCHATAPLTRYVDLIHQRLLHDIISKGRDRRSSRVKTGVDILSSSCHGQVNWSVLPPKRHKEWTELFQVSLEHLNDREATAREAETELAGLKRSEYMQQHVGKTVTGLIVGVQNYGFFVLTDPVLAEGLVHVSSLKDDWYEYRSRQQALVGRKSRQQFQVGDRIEVEVKSVDYYRQQIDLGIVGGGKPYEGDDD